jgi:hypothetical protein
VRSKAPSVPLAIWDAPIEFSFIDMQDEATYLCDSCGEEIVVPVDLSAGHDQTYVEDCSVCCRPHVIHIHIDDDGQLNVTSDPE